MLADLPTDVDRVQQYRTDNAITLPPEATVTTAFQQPSFVPTAVMTSANLPNPMHFAATQFLTSVSSVPVVGIQGAPYTVMVSTTGMPTHSVYAVPSSNVHGIQPLDNSPIYAPPLTTSQPATLNPHAQRFTPQVSIHRDTTTEHVSPHRGNAPNAMAELIEQMYLSRVPAPEPPIFTGDPLQYAAWKSAFKALIDQRRIPANEKIHYLKKILSGKARECIEGYFLYTSSSTYEEAKAVLEKRFGDKYALQHAFREKLENFPRLSSGAG